MWVGKLIKNNNNTDVAFFVQSEIKSEQGIFVKGMWFNIVNPDKEFVIDRDEFLVTKDYLKDWEVYKE